MEEGSLLEEALHHRYRRKKSSGLEALDLEGSQNLLILDVFRLWNEEEPVGQQERLLQLERLAGKVNSFLQSQKFHWHYGGDGPVFGIHVDEDDRIPHLRAYVRYGPSVADEWIAIDAMLTMSKKFSADDDENQNVAIRCWDVEDGQVILIQTSDVLPAWVDEDPTDLQRNACWIRDGEIQILKTPHVSLEKALKELQKQPRRSLSSHTRIHAALIRWLEQNRTKAHATQRMPLVLPRKVALLLQERPDLVHTAIQSFCDHIDEPPPSDAISSYEDWVWATTAVSRTNYAMLRTIVSPSYWKSNEILPPLGVELKRYKRQCAMEATPHIRHAVQLGVRVVLGFHYLLEKPSKPSTRETFSLDRRLVYWCRVEKENNIGASSSPESWIMQSYQLGPNHAPYDLEHILKCPVFPEESSNTLTLLSHPAVSIRQQLLNGMKSKESFKDIPMPRRDQVDDESWMILDEKQFSLEGNNLDSILSKFQGFMTKPSGIEGVTTGSDTATAPGNIDMTQNTRGDIRANVVLNILHSVLKGESLSFPHAEDPFFHKDDYDLMEAGQGDEENGDDKESGQVLEMRDMMKAMDLELEAKTKSREFDSIRGNDNVEIGSKESKEVAENAHVLNNLLKSLDASAGDAGPVRNILKEMGIETP